MKRVLVLGGMGMLGHALVARLQEGFQVATTLRDTAPPPHYAGRGLPLFTGIDLTEGTALEQVLDAQPWDALVNAAGMIKQRDEASDPVATLALNSLLPQRLAQACGQRGIRLIHFSTDCVFSGLAESSRGPRGYRESDRADATDLYGRSKLLGEPSGPGCLTLRTSIVGPELRGHHGLLAWFLRQPQTEVPGFTQALFTGISTAVAADLVARLLEAHPALDGLYHVAAEPISKHDLLCRWAARLRPGLSVRPEPLPFCDRRLDGTAFQTVTGWQAPAWDEMIEQLAAST